VKYRVADWCLPYEEKASSKPLDCSIGCAEGLQWSGEGTMGTFAKGDPNLVELTKKELFENGPLGMYVMATDEFTAYTSGVFQGTIVLKPTDSNHAVTLVGYGTEGGLDYWLVLNSWGEEWGEKGYIKIARGNNEVNCEIEGFQLVTPTTSSSCDSSSCGANGEPKSDCSCKCSAAWTGDTCTECAIKCANGGTEEAESCTCTCPAGLSGITCTDGYGITGATANGDGTVTVTMMAYGTKFNVGDRFILAKAGADGYNSDGKIVNYAPDGGPLVCGAVEAGATEMVGCAGDDEVETTAQLDSGDYVIYYFKYLGFNELGQDKGYSLNTKEPSVAYTISSD